MQNLQMSIRTNAELNKSLFGQMQNLQKAIRTNAELTKVNSDKCRTYKSQFGQMQNLQKSIRTNDNSQFGQMQLPRLDPVKSDYLCPITRDGNSKAVNRTVNSK